MHNLNCNSIDVCILSSLPNMQSTLSASLAVACSGVVAKDLSRSIAGGDDRRFRSLGASFCDDSSIKAISDVNGRAHDTSRAGNLSGNSAVLMEIDFPPQLSNLLASGHSKSHSGGRGTSGTHTAAW